MPKRIPPLTDEAILCTVPREQNFKLVDGYGLYLLITSTGSKLWRLDYRSDGKQKTITLGQYPTVSLDDARQRRDDARKLLANGQNPATAFKEEALIERTTANTTTAQTVSVRVGMDGAVDIWKGRFAVRLTTEEASFIKNQLCKLLN